MDEERMVKRSLRGMWGYRILFVLSMTVCSFVFSYYSISQDTLEKNELSKTKQLYGDYTYEIYQLDENQMEEVERDGNTKRWMSADYRYGQKNTVLSVRRDFFAFTNYSVVRGRIPEDENEILVPKWYLFQMGVKDEEIPGAKIQIEEPESGKTVEKTVSGIYAIQHENSDDTDMDELPVFIKISQEHEKQDESVLYVEWKSYRNMNAGKYMEGLKDKLQSEEELNYSFNEELSDKLGITEESKIRIRNQKILSWTLFLVIVLFAAGIQRNLIKFYFFKWKKVFDLYKLLGTPFGYIRRYVCCFILGELTLGFLLGFLASVLSVAAVNKGSLTYSGIGLSGVISVPFIPILLCLFLLAAIDFIMITKRFCFMEKNSALDVRQWNSTGKRNFANKRTLFSGKRNGLRYVKYALRNSICHVRNKTGVVVTMAFCVVIFVFLNISLRDDLKTVDNNDGYHYRFDVIDYYSLKNPDEAETVKVVYHNVTDILKKKDVTVYYDGDYIEEFELDKDLLTEEYEAGLKKTANGYMELLNSKKTISTKLRIMGCSSEMLRLLIKDYSGNFSKEGNLIVLGRTINQKSGESYKIKSMKGKQFEISSPYFMEDNSENIRTHTITCTVTEMTDRLLVYPYCGEDTVCALMELDQFNKYFNENFVNSFYVSGLDSGTLDEVQEALQGISFIKLHDQFEETSLKKAARRQKMVMIYSFIIIFYLLTGINILLQTIHEMKNRKREFEFLNIIGLQTGDINRIIALELIFSNVSGTLAGLCAVKGLLILIDMYFFAIHTGTDFGAVLICAVSAVVFTAVSYLAVRIAPKS